MSGGVQSTFSGCGQRCDECWCLPMCGGCHEECSVHNCAEDCEYCAWTCCQDTHDQKAKLKRFQVEHMWDVKWEPFEFDAPLLIPQVNGKVRQIQMFDKYVVSLKMLVNWRQALDGEPYDWRKNVTARKVCDIPDDNEVLLTFTVKDSLLDWFYLRMQEEATVEHFRALGVDYAFGANFSLYWSMPRMEQLVNLAWSLESITFFQKAGIKVIPHVQWVEMQDRDAFAAWVTRENVSVVSTNFQMIKTNKEHKGRKTDWTRFVDELQGFVDQIPSHTQIIIMGTCIPRRLAFLRRQFGPRLHVTSANPWCLATYGLGLMHGKRTRFKGWKTENLFRRNCERLLMETYQKLVDDDIKDDRKVLFKEKVKTDKTASVTPTCEESDKPKEDLPGQRLLFGDMDEWQGECEEEIGEPPAPAVQDGTTS